MRAFLSILSLVLLPEILSAQGAVIPRPCRPELCIRGRICPPCGPVIPTVVKQSSHVRADLTDRVLRYEVTEILVNRGGGIGEADYIFPLPKGAAFQDLKLSIDGELVAGEAMSAERARGIYEQIVRQQRDPALVEWMGYGMLRARIFPIAPGEEKKVVVRFQMVAEREGDAIRVDYFQGTQRMQRDERDRRDSQPESMRRDKFSSSFMLTYPDDRTYGNAYSPTHTLSSTRRGSRREVRASGSSAEITVLIPVRRASEAAISVLTYAPRSEDGFALITLSPPAVASRVTARDVTLVLDVSGSMSGVKIRQAREAGKQLLATLEPSDRFKLIDFSTDVRTFRDGFVRATSQNIAEGSRYLESLDASGSTNISGALDAALQGEVTPGRLGLVMFVTDGEPTVGERDPEAIASRVARLRRGRRIFSFGVGANLNAALVERLAVEGRGTAHFVRPEESVERAVSLVASRLTNPVVTDVRVRADGVRLIKRHPTEAADIFAGQDYVLLARYTGSGSSRVTFEGETANGPISWSTRVAFPSSSRENSFVARLWATQRVGYLAAEKRRNGANGGNGGNSEIDEEIRELGEKYAIPTEFTSYLVVEPGMRRTLSDGRSSNVTISSPVTVLRGKASGATVAAGAPPPAAATTAERAFESARTAAGQRAATNLAAADEVDLSKRAEASATRRVGTRTFLLRDGQWIDTRPADSTQAIKIRAFSEAYFKLIDVIPELREVFALGDKVKVAGRDVVIEVSDEGKQSLSDSELRSIQSRW